MISSMKKSKLFIFCLVFNFSLNIIAMEKLTLEEREKLSNAIDGLRFIAQDRIIFTGKPEERQCCIKGHTLMIKCILNSHSMVCPEGITWESYWLQDLQKELNDYINIKGLNKIAVAQALFRHARPVKDTFERPINLARIDCIGQRVIKADLSRDIFNANLYNEANGKGMAQRAIAKLRARQLKASISSSDDDQVSENGSGDDTASASSE